MYKKNVYVHKECWFEYTQVKWKQTIEVYLYLSIKEVSVLCIDKICMYLEKDLICTRKYYVHKIMLWDLHRKEAHWLESSFTGNNAPFNTNGISVYKQTNENKRKKFVYVWILTKMFWICTMKFRYVHKRIGTYTVREAHDRLRNSRENEFGFIV